MPEADLAAVLGTRQSPQRRPSELLQWLAGVAERDIAVEQIITSIGNRAFGAGILLFAIPVLLPLPAGLSQLMGVPLILFATQLMLGRELLWLPAFLSERRIPLNRIRPGLLRIANILSWAENYLQARNPLFCTRWANRLTGAACLVLSLILLVPIPFSSLIPAFALTVFSLGLIYRDGVMIAFGWLFTILASLVAQFVTACMISVITQFFSTPSC